MSIFDEKRHSTAIKGFSYMLWISCWPSMLMDSSKETSINQMQMSRLSHVFRDVPIYKYIWIIYHYVYVYFPLILFRQKSYYGGRSSENSAKSCRMKLCDVFIRCYTTHFHHIYSIAYGHVYKFVTFDMHIMRISWCIATDEGCRTIVTITDCKLVALVLA